MLKKDGVSAFMIRMWRNTFWGWLAMAVIFSTAQAAVPGSIVGRAEIPPALSAILQQQGYVSLYQHQPTPAGSKPLSAEETLVYLERVVGVFPPATRHGVIHHKARAFLPRALPVLKGTGIALVNDDPYDHTIQVHSLLKPAWQISLKSGNQPYLFRPLQADEILLSCGAHLKSEGFLMVLQNPFFVTAGKDGSFSLKNVPPGVYTLKAWHPDLTPRSLPVTVFSGKESKVDILFEKVRYAP